MVALCAPRTVVVGSPAWCAENCAQTSSYSANECAVWPRRQVALFFPTCSGRQPTGKDAVAWAKEGVERGAGEIIVTSIDHEGTGRGLDSDLMRSIALYCRTPVVASGGIGAAAHVIDAADSGASAVAMSWALHLGPGLETIRRECAQAGLPVRMPVAA